MSDRDRLREALKETRRLLEWLRRGSTSPPWEAVDQAIVEADAALALTAPPEVSP